MYTKRYANFIDQYASISASVV